MDAELKAKWIAALRSGEFKQTRGYLKDDAGYCCLGVLCKVQGADFSKLVLKDISLRGFDGGTTLEDRRRLADMNDGRDGHSEHSFAQIADFIETKL